MLRAVAPLVRRLQRVLLLLTIMVGLVLVFCQGVLHVGLNWDV